MTQAATFIAGSIAAILLARAGINIMTAAVMSRFGKPILVRETSKISTDRLLKLPMMLAKRTMARFSRHSEKDLMHGVILNPELEAQIKAISYSVLNRRKHYAPYRNFLFYGPPGTGKTLFAKKLALSSGMDYAIMSGADISPLGAAAISEMHSMFEWTEKNNNGIILFIDEADAFLRKRKAEQQLSENLRNAINAFLYRTGSQSDKFMLIMATNTPEQLDEAILDRMDELVLFERPRQQERVNMIYHYLIQYCNPPKTAHEKLRFLIKHPKSLITGKKLIGMEGVDSKVIESIATKAEGFSGREIVKMVVAWHDAAFALDNPVLTPDLMNKIQDKLIEMHGVKQGWGEKESELLSKIQSPELIARMHGSTPGAEESKIPSPKSK
jgi:ATPase family AAA domain-containing protein 3A/B